MKARLLFSLAFILASLQVQAEVAVIVHPSNDVELSQGEIKRLYLLKEKYFPGGGDEVNVYNLAGDEKTRTEFYEKVLQKDEARINSQWARALFSSKAAPPRDVDTAEEMKKAVANNPDALGFIDASDVDDSVRVVLKM